MPRNRNYFSPGSNNCYCQICGKKVKAFEIKIKYDNLKVCSECWNPRHPGEFAPILRPELPPTLISPIVDIILPQCDIYHTQDIPSIGVPSCIIPGRYLPGAPATSFLGEPFPEGEE